MVTLSADWAKLLEDEALQEGKPAPVYTSSGLAPAQTYTPPIGFDAVPAPGVNLNSASRSIINNPEMQASDARFDASTDPAQRGGVGLFGGLMNLNPLLKDIQTKAGDIAAKATGAGLSVVGPQFGGLATLSDALGGPGLADINRFGVESILPGSVAEAGLMAAGPLVEGALGGLKGLGLAADEGGELAPFAGKARSFLQNPGGTEVVIPKHFPADLAERFPGGVRLAGGAAEDLSEWERGVSMLSKTPEERAAAETAFKAAEAARMNAEAADNAVIHKTVMHDTKKLRTRAQTVGDLMDRMKAEAAANPVVDKVLGDSKVLRTPRANANAARAAGYDPVKIAEGVIKYGPEEGLTGPLPRPVAVEEAKPGGFMATVGANVRDAAGAPMALKTTISPALLRQGMIRLITSPKAALEETGMSIKAALSEADARAFQKALLDHPWSTPEGSPFAGFTAADVKLKVRDWGTLADAEDRATEFAGLGDSAVSKGLQKLPHVKFSDRQYALEFNAHALNRYGEVAQRMWDAKIFDKAAYSDLARVIEHQQHYGSWPQGKIPVFFSTRAMSGRAQAITDLFTKNPASLLKPGAAQEAWKGAIALVGANMAMMGAATQLPGFDIVTKSGMPTLKTPLGTVDPWAGWSTIARVVYDVGTLAKKDIGEGSIDDLGPDFKDRVARFLRGQLSPVASKGADLLTGKDYLGNKYHPIKDAKTIGLGDGLLSDFALPMIVESIVEGYKNYGVAGAAVAAGLEGISGSIAQYNGKEEQASTKLFDKSYDKLDIMQQAQVHGEMTRNGQEVDDKRRTGPYFRAQEEAFNVVKASQPFLAEYKDYDAYAKAVDDEAKKAGKNRHDREILLSKLNDKLGITDTRDKIRKVLVMQDPDIVDAIMRRNDDEAIESYPSKELIKIAEKVRAGATP